MPPSPPRAPKRPHVEHRHGEAMDDPYAWLKDADWQLVLKEPARLTPEIRAYIEAENAYAKQMMADTAELQTRLFAELKGRLKENDASVPLKDGPYEYFTRYAAGAQYPQYWRRKSGGQGGEEVILDVPELAKGHKFFRVSAVQHSPDHKLVAYAVDTKGSERYDVCIREIATGKALPDQLADAGPGVVWGNDSLTLYYSVLDEHQRPKWVNRHCLGSLPTADETLYEEKDDGFFLSLARTRSRRFVVLSAYDHTCSEVHVLSADDPTDCFRLIEGRQPGVIYEVTHHGERFFIELHEGEQKDGRLMTAPVAAPGRASWREFLPFQAGRLIEQTLLFQDFMVRHEMVEALPRIVVRDLKTGSEHSIDFTEASYYLTVVGGYEFDTRVLRFTYSSMATPECTFDYDMATRSRTLLKQQEVPSGHRPEDYEIRRFMAPARDGEMVPVSLLRHKTLCSDGAPLLLYGYGSYGRSMPTSFSPHRFGLVDRGVAYAIAHIRGGKEKGYAWYESAKVLTKKRTFHDFIDAAKHLVHTGITRRGQIIAHGGSAGGMLMGAVANMEPELFLGMIADVPFVDVLNTMWDKDLPLTPPEWPEWGNPILSKEAHDYIRSYSPYDNIERKEYPHMLVLAGLTDPRVTYWEPAKWVARLRELKRGDQMLLLDINMGAGHAGASGRFDILNKVALQHAFVLKVCRKHQGS